MKSLQKKLCLIPLFCSLAAMGASPLDLGGYYKNFSVALVPPGMQDAPSFYSSESPLGLVNNRLRLNLSARLCQRFSFTAAYDLSPRIQDPALYQGQIFITELDPFHYRVVDLPHRLYPAEQENVRSFVLSQNLDRAFFTLKTGRADLDIGRQAIAWGSARVINPTDVIAPFSFEELDIEDRIGVDAVRLRVPMGFMGELDGGVVFAQDFRWPESACYLRGKFYLAKTDVSLLLIDFQQNLLVGLDLARSLGGAGVWCEAAGVIADGSQHLRIDQANYVRATIGVDYNFSSRTYGFLEYHFSSAGAAQPQDYLDIFTNPAIARGGIYLMGRHYLIPAIVYQITPLIIASAQILTNLADGSLFAAPHLEYNIAENIYLAAGVYWSLGRRPELQPEAGYFSAMALQSEFGSYPDMYYTSFRIYF